MFAAIAENPKLNRAEALPQAMLATMDDRTNPEWVNPTSWAPFVLVGEGGLVLWGCACTAVARALAEVEAARLGGIPVVENRIVVT